MRRPEAPSAVARFVSRAIWPPRPACLVRALRSPVV